MQKYVIFKFWIFAVTRDCASKLHGYKLLFWLPKFEQINLWVRESAPNKVLHADGATPPDNGLCEHGAILCTICHLGKSPRR
jgi:hypothetical protein